MKEPNPLQAGQKFGEWEILYRDKEKENERKLLEKNTLIFYRCRCSCGKEFSICKGDLTGHKSTSCGHNTNKRHTQQNKIFVGQKIGRLTIIEEDLNYKKEHDIKSNTRYWKCQCDCGNIKSISDYQLKWGGTQSCGCLIREKTIERNHLRAYDLTGKHFGYLTAIKKLEERNESKEIMWLCKCSNCGKTAKYSSSSLVSGRTISCGCIHSRGEDSIKTILENNNISYESQKSFEGCVSPKGVKLRFDFYINNQFLLEFDGIQHYKSFSGWSSEENYLKNIEYDRIKNQWCYDNNIPLKRIPYWDLDNITVEDIMSNKYLIQYDD